MKLIFYLFFSFTSSILIAQNEASTIFFGNCLIDFRFYPPSIIYPIDMETTECVSSICSSNGDILFYSNGGKSPTSNLLGGIWNKNNVLMENGILGADSSGCVSSYQGSIIVPFPSGLKKLNANLYYLFTRDCLESTFSDNNFNAGLTYSVVDMNENEGLGKVIQKNVPLVEYSVVNGHKTNHEPVTAILHGNNIDYWLFSYKDETLYRLLITEDGISDFTFLEIGESKIAISPDRKYLAIGSQMYQFESFTGEINFLEDLGDMFQLTFSPDGTKLYATENHTLYQMDMNQSNILASKIALANFDGGLFLAANHKIYLFEEEQHSFIGEIRCPNSSANTCEFSFITTSIGSALTGIYSNVMAHYLFYEGACTADLKKQSISENLQLVPNPANNQILVLSNQHIENVEVISLSGTLISVETINNKSAEINVSTLEKGFYLFKFRVNGDVLVKKIQVE
jgi:hypothetical protein